MTGQRDTRKSASLQQLLYIIITASTPSLKLARFITHKHPTGALDTTNFTGGRSEEEGDYRLHAPEMRTNTYTWKAI